VALLLNDDARVSDHVNSRGDETSYGVVRVVKLQQDPIKLDWVGGLIDCNYSGTLGGERGG